MSQQNTQISFIEVEFFPFSLPKLEQIQSCSKSEQQTLMGSQELDFMDQQIFIEFEEIKSSESTSSNFKSKSILHNFQKHSFTFIQSLIPQDFDQIVPLRNDIQNCVKKIFFLLKSQKKKTRQDLMPIFGDLNMARINRLNLKYKDLIDEFSVGVLKESLQKVKDILMQKINGETIKQYASKSKMVKKVEFTKYMESFINEVQEGRFTCRLTKRSQNQIKQKISEEIKQNEWQNLIL